MITNDDIEGMNDGQMPEWNNDDLHWRYNYEVAIKHDNEMLRARVDALLKIVDDNTEEIAKLWASLSSVPPSRR